MRSSTFIFVFSLHITTCQARIFYDYESKSMFEIIGTHLIQLFRVIVGEIYMYFAYRIAMLPKLLSLSRMLRFIVIHAKAFVFAVLVVCTRISATNSY